MTLLDMTTQLDPRKREAQGGKAMNRSTKGGRGARADTPGNESKLARRIGIRLNEVGSGKKVELLWEVE